MENLLRGSSISDAAREASVHRSTIHRWQHDPVFHAALNQRRTDLRTASDSRLEHLLTASLEVVEAALGDGNVQVAMSLLRGLGYLSGKPATIGPTSADRVAKQQELEEANRRMFESLGFVG